MEFVCPKTIDKTDTICSLKQEWATTPRRQETADCQHAAQKPSGSSGRVFLFYTHSTFNYKFTSVVLARTSRYVFSYSAATVPLGITRRSANFKLDVEYFYAVKFVILT